MSTTRREFFKIAAAPALAALGIAALPDRPTFRTPWLFFDPGRPLGEEVAYQWGAQYDKIQMLYRKDGQGDKVIDAWSYALTERGPEMLTPNGWRTLCTGTPTANSVI